MIVNRRTVCESNAVYGLVSKGPNGTTENSHGRGAIESEKDMPGWQTIRNMTSCGDHVDVRKGDIVKIIAHYDLDKHPQ
jgi:hypothetical protein